MSHSAFIASMKGRAILAPMAGVTDATFRLLCHEFGCAFDTTEMVSAKGYLLSPRQAISRGLLDVFPKERVSVQLFGHEPQVIAEVAKQLSTGSFQAIDLNMGCPAPKITNGGEGSALMRTPHLAQAIAKATVEATHLPVTVKMRLGFTANNRCYVEFAKRLEDVGIAAVAVHGRTRDQMYAGHADWDAIGELVQAVTIPVIGNGDVRDVESFCAIQKHTGCHAVMIGRGALGNPFLFRDIARHEAGFAPKPTENFEKIQTALRHAAMLCSYKGERTAIPEMRKHIAWYLHGFEGGASIRRTIQQAENISQIEEIFRDAGLLPR